MTSFKIGNYQHEIVNTPAWKHWIKKSHPIILKMSNCLPKDCIIYVGQLVKILNYYPTVKADLESMADSDISTIFKWG